MKHCQFEKVTAAVLVAAWTTAYWASCACTLAAAQDGQISWMALENCDLVVLPDSRRTLSNTPSTEALPVRIDLLVHFHGQRDVVLRNCREQKIRGAVVVVNFKGLSDAYRRPFSDPQRFERLLDQTQQRLREAGQLAPEGRLDRIDISAFSAGYGAVREILKHQHLVDRVHGVLMADSIYAGFQGDARLRQVDEMQMSSFLNFARRAVNGQKRMIVTFSQLETPSYASTSETARYLASALSIDSTTKQASLPAADVPKSHLQLLTKAQSGNLSILGYDGADGPAHLEHLRQMGQWLPLLRPALDDSSP